MHPALLEDDPFDRQLVDQVHPADWFNPRPEGRYNLLVVGAGTAGLISAIGAAGLGAKVALIERDLMGGDCLNVGCVPSKALLRSARAARAVADAGRLGIQVPPGITVDFPAVMERLRRLRAGFAPNDSAARYRDRGIDVYFGQATFTGRDTVTVGGTELRFTSAVIATGGRAWTPPIPGLQEAGCLTNETVFSLAALPKRLAVLGGGPIGCELSQAFARFGSQVTLIDKDSQLLPREDADAAGVVGQALLADGVVSRFSTQLLSVEVLDGSRTLVLDGPQGIERLEVDAILAATGRVPNVDGLGLDQAEVAYDPRTGVRVDDRLRTTNHRIYAAGDVASKYRFTHAADAMARIVIQNALFLGRSSASALVIPWCTYTDPELAHVGLTEREAADRGVAIDTYLQEFKHVDRAVLDGETEGFVKLHTRRGTDRIVGATIVSAHAGELIGEISLLMTNGLGLKQVGRTIRPYPTQSEALKRIADSYSRTRLTPLIKRLFEMWLRWRR